jgi:hypothetical protein
MIQAIATLKSASSYQMSAPVLEAKKPKETSDAYEVRTWIERGHWNKDGFAFIPPMAFKIALSSAAKFLGLQIPGKGKSTYTKHFESGILITEPIITGHTRDTIEKLTLFVPSDGIKGSGKRVWKHFPVVPEWSGKLNIFVLDATITQAVLAEHIDTCGKFIGVGAFRPQSGGYFGRFALEKLEWSE